MATHSLYVDESGAMKAQSGDPLGLRLVGGMLCAGDADHHRRTLAPAVRAGFDWFHESDPHANELTSNKVRWVVRNTRAPIPWRLERVRRAPRVTDEIRRICDDEAMRLRRGPLKAAREVETLQVLVACEHDLEEEAGESRYQALLAAAVERALWMLAHLGGKRELHVFVEPGATGWPKDGSGPAAIERAVTPVLQDIEAHHRLLGVAESSVVLGPIVTLPKNAHPGLTLADFALYPIAAREREKQRWHRLDCTTWSIARLHDLQSVSGLRIEATGPGAVSSLFRRWAIGEIDSAVAVNRLNGWCTSPPQGVLAAVAESTRDRIAGWTGRSR